jgi:multidrug efflux pump subunit AcrB
LLICRSLDRVIEALVVAAAVVVVVVFLFLGLLADLLFVLRNAVAFVLFDFLGGVS